MADFTTKEFSDWLYQDAKHAIDAEIEATVTQAGYDKNKLFIEDGDHWQDGANWVGPTGGETRTRELVLAAVEPQFTPNDVIGEVLDRVVNALMQREAEIDFVPIDLAEGEDPTDAQAEEVATMRSLLADWWDRVSFWEDAKQATKRSRYAVRGLLRLWLPTGRLATRTAEDGEPERTLPSPATFADALDLIECMAPLPGDALVYTDPNTQRMAALFFYELDRQKRCEMWFIDPASEQAVLRVMGDGDDRAEEYRLNIGGRLPIVQMEADLLITEAVRRQQNRLNFIETLIVRVAECSGFPERYTLNAEPHGLWLPTPPTNSPPLADPIVDGTRTWHLHQAPRSVGAAITTDLVGIMDRDPVSGTDRRATPGVVFRDPTDPEYAVRGARHSRDTILESCHQAHILINSDATASGRSREQARADFEDDLSGTKSPAENMVRALFESLIAWAAQLSGENLAFLEEYRVVVNLNVNSGPVSPEEKEANRIDVEKGLLSVEGAMAANGVEDVEAEIQRIRESPEGRLSTMQAQVTIMQEMVREGASWTNAAKLVGIVDPEQLKVLAAIDQEAATNRAQSLAFRSALEDVAA